MNYLNDRLLDTQLAMLKIEKDWLKSIKAPVRRLPKHVAEAVATRMVLSTSLDGARQLGESITVDRILNQIW